MNTSKWWYFLSVMLAISACTPRNNSATLVCSRPVLPVLAGKDYNHVLSLSLVRKSGQTLQSEILKSVSLELEGTTRLADISQLALYAAGANGKIDPNRLLASIPEPKAVSVTLPLDFPLQADTSVIWVSVRLKDSVDLLNRININCTGLVTTAQHLKLPGLTDEPLRVAVALRQHWQDSIHTSRIPGLTTSRKGTLLAIYDGRKDSDRDLQGDMDICLNRSTDGGRTWQPKQVVLDMKTWGGLPEKYNGVSDANILVDENTGTLFVIGLWMHGIQDPKTGKWVEGLTQERSDWNHQWKSFGSQPGYSVTQSAQVMITRSTDDGITWSPPENITRQVKKESWWLMAPAPGHGITLNDGTLVVPAEGRDEKGLPFSTILYSKNGGKNWETGNPADSNTNECMAVQLSDGSIMLNMRERSNRGKKEKNGRAIAISKDLGKTWTTHPTSRTALIEPACMASLHKHIYQDGKEKKEALLFLNPSSISTRNQFTLKLSLDDGLSWPEANWLLLDEWNGNGYSCITSIDQETIGVLYEGSQADLVFQQIKLSEILKKKITNDEKK